MNEETRATVGYLVQLLKAALDKTQPLEKPDNITFEQIYHLAKFHNVQCMAYYAIEKLANMPEPERNRKWKSERDQHIVSSLTQLSERDMIIEHLTSVGIDVLPLKGCLLKEMYPQADYREMADLDILIDGKKADLARKQMERLGYKTIHFQVGNHDNYEKPPFMGVELHTNMIAEQYETHAYYKDVWKKAVADTKRTHCFHFSWNDYYIFMLIHFAKHYYGGGSGIRSIMDIHVFLDKHRHDLNQEYLKKELIVLDLYEFKETAEQLSEYWFGNTAFTKKAEEMAEYVITSGVYGTHQRRINNQIKKAEDKANSVWRGKVSYFLSRTFLPYKVMCSMFPLLKKNPILLPICWIVRLVSSAINKRDLIQMELQALMSDTQKEE